MISPGAIWPRRSRVAWTLELKPFANLLADWPMFKLDKLDCNLLQPSIVDVCVGAGETVVVVVHSGERGLSGVRQLDKEGGATSPARDAYAYASSLSSTSTPTMDSVYRSSGFDFSNSIR